MRSTREVAGSDFTIAAQSDAACGSCYESEALLVFFHQPGQRGERVVGGLAIFGLLVELSEKYCWSV
jgi:hypothetical protein